ncbi:MULTISPECIES: TniQ family protein [Pacificibacter]|uniref:TniQ family protein n=1 Tax=Pacificibacter TaxID=1042323 RepID=UPI001C09C9B8|nr:MULTISPECIES: TniQ family protein [Pacificibacter]MBU2936466.1 TniQ family protein [Pacificibacter marinus]MDO6614732.1 TniQ family protein [Pacificibacter sp. 1_MG-2023]
MTILPISNPSPAPRETLYSYLARLAAVWQTDARDLAYDMGAPYNRLLDQDEDAIEALAGWANLIPDVTDELLSWTGVRAGNVRMQFRGELFISRALRNPVMRGCPVCLRKDTSNAKGPAFSAMVMRGDWQFREVNLCVRHGHPIVPLWETKAIKDRFDIGARLREIEEKILSGGFDQPRLEPSNYDLWLDRRLEDGDDNTWFKDQPVHIVAPLCRLIGQATSRLGTSNGAVISTLAHSAGFDVVVQGKGAIRATLDQIASTATKSSDEPRKIFGMLYSQLDRDYRNEPGFHPFRSLLRECVLDHWPRAAGDVVLGHVVKERRRHSLTTAALETGIGIGVLEHFLVEAGVFKTEDGRPHSRKLFDAEAHSALLAEIPTLVGPIAMRKAMGATHKELVALENEELLIPRTKVKKIKSPWRISDGTVLVAELLKNSILVDENESSWETLLHGSRRRAITLKGLVCGIKEGQLTVGKRIGVEGFHGIVVQKTEVNRLAGPRTRVEGEVLDDEAGTMSAAEFGRSIGLRDGEAILALIKAGYVSARLITSPLTARLQYRMTPNDMANFNQRFVTLSKLSAETGQHRNTIRGIFKSARVAPFSPDGQDFGAVYLRDDVAGLVRKDGRFEE